MPENNAHHEVLVVGGGNGGISVAARLRRRGVGDIAIIEPREHHLYQPLFSHVAGGTARASITVRPQRDVMPKGVEWIRGRTASIDPDAGAVTLEDGRLITYDHVILTEPPGPASCAGASQKPMYQACDYWRAKGVLDDIRVIMVVPTHSIYGIPAFDRELERNVAKYGIEVRTDSELAEVDAAASEVVLIGPEGAERIHYDVLNVVPPQSAPDWLADSPLVAPDEAGGFVEVDTRTLRHPRYGNVWTLGDAAATTNSKCGGALRKQTLVLAENLVAVRDGRQPRSEYDGYAVCPFTVSRSTVVWAEFDAEGQLAPTIPFWKSMYRENRLAWIADRHVLPWVYWNLILKGLV